MLSGTDTSVKPRNSFFHTKDVPSFPRASKDMFNADSHGSGSTLNPQGYLRATKSSMGRMKGSTRSNCLKKNNPNIDFLHVRKRTKMGDESLFNRCEIQWIKRDILNDEEFKSNEQDFDNKSLIKAEIPSKIVIQTSKRVQEYNDKSVKHQLLSGASFNKVPIKKSVQAVERALAEDYPATVIIKTGIFNGLDRGKGVVVEELGERYQ